MKLTHKLALCCVTAAMLLSTAALCQQQLTYNLAPYDLCSANWTASNYLQALFSSRWKTEAFAQDAFGDATGHNGLYFPDDMGRVIRALVQEAEYSPIARVDAVSAMAEGLLAAKMPKSPGRYFFSIDGRKAVFFRPKDDTLSLQWLQDTNTPVASLRIELSVVPVDWHTVRFSADTPIVKSLDEDVYSAESVGSRIEAHNFSGCTDRAPCIDLRSDTAVDVKITFTQPSQPRSIVLGKNRLLSADAPVADVNLKANPYLALRVDSQYDNAHSAKRGWERPELWNALDTYTLLAWPQGQSPTLNAEAEQGYFKTVSLVWHKVRTVRLYAAPMLEVDPESAGYIRHAGNNLSKSGAFGFGHYLSTRPGNGFGGSVVGLASAAWLLQQYHRPNAGAIRSAAIEAFAAATDSAKRGYFGVYEYNLIEAAEYLKRIAPNRFPYAQWARIWADRDLARRPAGTLAPPWTDASLRAVRCWFAAYRVTGDAKYREAAEKAMSEFALPEHAPFFDGFLWRGTARAWDSFECTGGAMLIGSWGAMQDSRADQMVQKAGQRYLCDYGFIPYRTWTCDDLLPYYVGYSLPAVFGAKGWAGKRRLIAMDEFVSYDSSGKIQKVAAPPFTAPAAQLAAGSATNQ